MTRPNTGWWAGSLGILLLTSPATTSAQAPTQPSFDHLPAVLRPNERVIVMAADGSTVRGHVAGITDDTIAVEWRRFFRTRRVSLQSAAVQQIERRDSTWDGFFLGLGAGIAAQVVAYKACGSIECDVAFLLSPWVGAFIGERIDDAHNVVVFRSRRRATASFSPVVVRRGAAVTASFEF